MFCCHSRPAKIDPFRFGTWINALLRVRHILGHRNHTNAGQKTHDDIRSRNELLAVVAADPGEIFLMEELQACMVVMDDALSKVIGMAHGMQTYYDVG